MAKYCTGCGSKLIEGAKFCQKCGNRMDTVQVTQPAQPIQQQVKNPVTGGQSLNVPPSKKKKKGGCLKGFLIGIGAIFVVIVLGIVGLLSGGDSDTPTDDWISDRETVTVAVELSEENLVEQTISGVEVTIPPYILEGEAQLRVSDDISTEQVEEITSLLPVAGQMLKAIDLTMGEQEAFGDFIEVKVSLASMGLSVGDEKLDRLVVYTHDELNGALIPELYEIEGNNLVMYLNHFSTKIIVEDTEGSFAANLKKAKEINMTREELERLIPVVEADNADTIEAMKELGFNALGDGVGWAGNFTTYTSAMTHTPQMKGVYDKLGNLGNLLFFLKLNDVLNQAVLSGEYKALGKTIKNDGVGFLIANYAATPIQLGYTTGVVLKFIGDSIMDEVAAGHDAKFLEVVDELLDYYMKTEAKGSGQVYIYKKQLRDRLIEEAKSCYSKDDFKKVLDAETKKMANDILTKYDYQVKFAELVEKYVGEHQNDDTWSYIVNRDFERAPDEKIKERLNQLIQMEMQVVLKSMTRTMQKQTEQAYYRQYSELLASHKIFYPVTFEIQGTVPESVTDMVIEFYDAHQMKTLYDFAAEGKTTEKELNFSSWMNMGQPRVVRLIFIEEGSENEPETFMVPYQFEFGAHRVVFDVGYGSGEENEDEEVPDPDDDDPEDEAEDPEVTEDDKGGSDGSEGEAPDMSGGSSNITSLYGRYQGFITIDFVIDDYYERTGGWLSEGDNSAVNMGITPEYSSFESGIYVDMSATYQAVTASTIHLMEENSGYTKEFVATVVDGKLIGKVSIYQDGVLIATMNVESEQMKVIHGDQQPGTREPLSGDITRPEEEDGSDSESEQTAFSFEGAWDVLIYFPEDRIDWSMVAQMNDMESIPESERGDMREDIYVRIVENGGEFHLEYLPDATVSVSGRDIVLIIPDEDGLIYTIRGTMSESGDVIDCSAEITVMGIAVAKGSASATK